MRRRDVLRTCGGVAAAGLLAGCSGGDGGGRETETAAMEATDFEPVDDAGDLVVEVTVANDGDAEGTGTLYVTVEAGEEIARRSRDVTVPAGGETTVDVETPFSYEAFKSGGSISVDFYES